MSPDFKRRKAGNRKIDNLGRITIPKNLRDDLGVRENDEFEIGIGNIDGKTIIYLYKENLGNRKKKEMIAALKAMGVDVNG